jgi:DNA-directed RNA polymerase specialized sigma24 family protein
LIRARYSSDITVSQIAQQINKPVSTVYRSLARIREILFHCIERAIASDSHPVVDVE